MSKYVFETPLTQEFMREDYLQGEPLHDGVVHIWNRAEELTGLKGLAEEGISNTQKGWYSFSTPVWSYFGNNRGLPISCYGSVCADDTTHIIETHAEIAQMTKQGGGTSCYYGKLRNRGVPISKGGISAGPVSFMKLAETDVNVISQGSLRRGSCAVYLDIESPDFDEFMLIRSESSPIQHLNFGVCVGKKFMNGMIGGDKEYRRRWAKVLETRQRTGFPYIFFKDNANDVRPQWYKDQGLEILASNLCTEIMLPSNEYWSFVCCLASANMYYFDDFKNNPRAIKLLAYLLEAVTTEFIEKASKIKFMERAVAFAEANRALGIGWLGYHSYLQKNMIAFESMEAKRKNVEIAKFMKSALDEANDEAARLWGEPSVLKGYGKRWATTSAIAPTKSSAFIMGQVSESIQPHDSNYFIKDLAKGKFSIKNKELERVLEEKGKNTDTVWESILKNNGSVQHLDFLSEHEKAVFKTFSEISMIEVIQQAAQRQKYIDQGQSINLMIHPSTPIKDVNALLIEAHDLGIKSLYYQIPISAAQLFTNNLLSCKACEA